LARVRVGDLEQSMLELAAYLGHEGNRAALGSKAPDMVKSFEDLSSFGPTVLIRAAVVAADLVQPLWRGLTDDDPAPAIQAARAWLACPCDEHADRALRHSGATASRPVNLSPGYSAARASSAAGCQAAGSAWAASRGKEERVASLALGSVRAASTALSAWDDGVERLWAGVAAELIPWALGYRDAVRERVEARKREGANE
jgi:hypothetical protein